MSDLNNNDVPGHRTDRTAGCGLGSNRNSGLCADSDEKNGSDTDSSAFSEENDSVIIEDKSRDEEKEESEVEDGTGSGPSSQSVAQSVPSSSTALW